MFKHDVPAIGVVPDSQKSFVPSGSTTSMPTPPTQSVSLPSLDEINKQFADAQEDRYQIFEQSRRQHRIAFLEAITTRDESADRRNNEFVQLLEHIKVTYLTNRTARNNTFDAAEAKRDALYDKQEQTRENLFEVAEQQRERVFQQRRDHRSQFVGQLTQQRQLLFTQGRTKRKHVSDEVEATFALFDVLMEEENAAFFAAQEQRDAEMNALVNRLSSHDYGPLNMTAYGGEDVYPRFELTQNKKTTLPGYTPLTMTTRNDFPPFLREPLYRAVTLPSPPVISTHSETILPSYTPAVSQAPSMDRSFVKNLPRFRRPSVNELIKEVASNYDDLFQEQENHRTEVFTTDLKVYADGSECVEKDIKQSISSRPALFTKTSMVLRAVYTDDQERYRQIFTHKTFLQDSKDTHRQARFLAAQKIAITCFDEDQVFVLKHFTLSDNNEWDYLSVLQASIETLLCMFQRSLQTLIDKHATLFEYAMEEYRRRWGIPIPNSTASGRVLPPVGLSSVGPEFVCPAPGVSGQGIKVHSQPDSEGIAVGPEEMFNAETILEPLPEWQVPTVDSKLRNSDAFTSVLLKVLEDQRNTFISAQKRRQSQFEEDLCRKKEIMTIQNLEEERLFKKVQKTYREAAEAWELEYVQAFSAEEKKREASFLRAEKDRETAFLKMADEQQSTFTATLSSFEKAFFSMIEGLEKKAYQHEEIRLKNIMNWGHVKKHEVKRSVDIWRRTFKEAEGRRCKIFSELLHRVGA